MTGWCKTLVGLGSNSVFQGVTKLRTVSR
jgi:hypothetical protein